MQKRDKLYLKYIQKYVVSRAVELTRQLTR